MLGEIYLVFKNTEGNSKLVVRRFVVRATSRRTTHLYLDDKFTLWGDSLDFINQQMTEMGKEAVPGVIVAAYTDLSFNQSNI